MKPFLLRASILFALFFLPQTKSFAQNAGFIESNETTLTSVLKHSYINNPTLRAARADLSAVSETLPQAVSGWLPELTAQGSIISTDLENPPTDTLTSGSADGSIEKSIGLDLSQPIFRGGSTIANTSAAKNVIYARITSLIAQEQTVLLDVVTAYMDVYRDRALVDLNTNNLQVLSRQFDATSARFDVGELTLTDLQQAKARRADAKARLISAQGQLKASEARFRQLTKMPPQSLVLPEAILPLPPSLEQAIQLAHKDNPQIRSAIYTQKAARDDVDSVFGELLPSISFSANWDKSYDPSPGTFDESTSSAVGFVATIPLYRSGAVRSRIRQAKHVSNRRKIEITELRDAIEQNVIQNWETRAATTAEIDARLSQVEANEIAREGVAAEEDAGARSILDKLDAEQELLNSQVALITAQRDQVIARYALLAVTGGLTPGNLEFSDLAYNYQHYLKFEASDILNFHVDSVQE